MAYFAMSIFALLRQHLGERGHHIQVQPVDLVIETLRVQGPLRSENRHSVINVLFFLGCAAGKGLAQAPRSDLRDAGITRDGKGFQHDLLDDQAANKITLCDAAQKCFAEPLPMHPLDVARHVHSNLAALSSKRSSMPSFTFRMLQCIGYFSGIVTYLR